MSTTDEKIDGLTKTVETLSSTVDDLARMTAQGFKEMREEIHQENIKLRGDIDIMLDRHVGTFRKDYDELASRVKKLEELVLTK